MRRGLAQLGSDRPVDGSVDPAAPLWLGVNFWSRVGGPRMWPRYDGQTVAKELQVLADHGLTMTRSFFFWPDFMPAPDTVDPVLLDRFGEFLDLHSAIGMRTVPTLIVGHMSGENWDPAWRDGRDLYTDVWFVGRQAWFAEQVARRFAGHPAVAGWLLSNEMPLYGGAGTPETVSAWAQLLINGLRAGGATQPVSIGDGAWTIETGGQDSGYRLKELAPLVDWVGPHVYPMGDDVVRQHLRSGFLCELAQVGGRPVVLEEFGASSDFVSDENLGHYYRQVLHASLLGGATGWVAWNNTDFDDLVDEPPYRHHPFELHFGVTDSNGAPKPALRELAEFRALLDKVRIDRCVRADTQVGIVISSHVDSVYPFTDAGDRAVAVKALEQAYIAAREAGVPAGFVRESRGLVEKCRLYLVPSTKQLTGPGWRRLEELAHDGAIVYVSYSPGGTDNQRGPWYAGLDRIFGVRHQLRYGVVDAIETDTVEMTFPQPFHGVEKLSFTSAGNPHTRAFLPVEATEAEVLATDGNGRPALLRRAVGAGALVLCTYPLEAMAAAVPAVNPEQTWRLYAALAEAAGAAAPVSSGDPRVLVDCLDRADGQRFVWLVSQCGQELAVTPRAASGLALYDLDSGAEAGEVRLPPYGVRVLRTRHDTPPTTLENP